MVASILRLAIFVGAFKGRSIEIDTETPLTIMQSPEKELWTQTVSNIHGTAASTADGRGQC